MHSVMHLVGLVHASLAGQEREPLPVKGCEWYKVEDDADVERSHELVHDSCTFVEASTLRELDVLAVVDAHWRVMQDLFKSISLEGLEIQFSNFDDDFKCNEMNDCMLNRMLIR